MADGWFSIESYCKCGSTMKLRGRGSSLAVVEIRAIWLEYHIGPMHGSATPEQAKRARRKKATTGRSAR